MSINTFAPDLGGEGSGTGASSYRRVANENLLKSRAGVRGLWLSANRREHDNDELWRVSVRVAAFSDVDQGMVVEHIKECGRAGADRAGGERDRPAAAGRSSATASPTAPR